VATLAKFKTPKYARDQWAIVKNKLGGATSAAATPTSVKATPSRKRKKLEGQNKHTIERNGDDDADMQADADGGEEESIPTEIPSKKSKTPKWKKTLEKEKMKQVKVEFKESEVESEAEVEGNVNIQARETPGIQAQVDEQIKTEMQKDMDDEFADAELFRMD
jgi:hypothetical protein